MTAPFEEDGSVGADGSPGRPDWPRLSPALEREAKELVIEAFSRAKRSGKASWRHMTVAVLKNRLIQITSGAFDLRRYDAPSMRAFVSALPDLVDFVDAPGSSAGWVTLREGILDSEDDALPTPLAAQREPRRTIRPDLWRAAMDWGQDADYVLDPVTGHARHASPGDDLPVIDRITKDTYLAWRTAFIEEALASNLSTAEREAVEHWRDSAGPSRVLPRHLQDRWMTLLRSRVREHLVGWFTSQGLALPGDLDDTAHTVPVRPAPESLEAAVSVARLRDTIQRCVREMTYEELKRLNIPSEVVARLTAK